MQIINFLVRFIKWHPASVNNPVFPGQAGFVDSAIREISGLLLELNFFCSSSQPWGDLVEFSLICSVATV